MSFKGRLVGRDGRRLPDSSPRHYEIKELRARHYRMIELSLLGYNNKTIATILGVTPQNVSDVLNSPLAKEHLEVLRAQRDADAVNISREIKELEPEALRLIKIALVKEVEKQIEDPDREIDRTHLSLAQDVLDRGGHGAIKSETNLHLHLTPEDIGGLKRAAREQTFSAEVKVEDHSEDGNEAVN